MPHIRNATSGHYLGLTDRLQLGTDLLASCGKLLYAFLWQVSADIFNAEADMFDAKLFKKTSAGRCDRPGYDTKLVKS